MVADHQGGGYQAAVMRGRLTQAARDQEITSPNIDGVPACDDLSLAMPYRTLPSCRLSISARARLQLMPPNPRHHQFRFWRSQLNPNLISQSCLMPSSMRLIGTSLMRNC